MPTEIWSTLLAGGGELFGVWLGNRARAMRRQLDAAAKEAGRGRLFKMRRDVFLGAAQAIARANGAISQMPEVNTSNSDISALIAESNAAIAKVQLVANTETIAAVMAVQMTLAEAMAQLWPGRWSLLARNGRLTERQRVIAAQISDRHRWIELMAQQNARGDTDKAAFERLQAQSDFAEQRRVRFLEGDRNQIRQTWGGKGYEDFRKRSRNIPRRPAPRSASGEGSGTPACTTTVKLWFGMLPHAME